jgi:hypothetical protein
MLTFFKEALTFIFTMIAVGSLLVLLSAAAGAQTKTGWQIQVVKDNKRFTIGHPFPTKQLCEEVRFPVMIGMIHALTECAPVADYWNRD